MFYLWECYIKLGKLNKNKQIWFAFPVMRVQNSLIHVLMELRKQNQSNLGRQVTQAITYPFRPVTLFSCACRGSKEFQVPREVSPGGGEQGFWLLGPESLNHETWNIWKR